MALPTSPASRQTYSASVCGTRTSASERSPTRVRGDVSEMVDIESKLGPLDGIETGVIVDLFLSYRAVRAWDRMIALYGRMPVSLQRSTMMREQYGLALNRAGRWQEAVSVLGQVLEDQGPS